MKAAGYSGKALADKIGIKPGMVVWTEGGPGGLDLGPTLGHLPEAGDCLIFFTDSRAELERRLPALVEHTRSAGMLWLCWPKKASKVPTDLDENVVRRLGLSAGVVDVKVAAVTEVWSGLKFVRRVRDREPPAATR